MFKVMFIFFSKPTGKYLCEQPFLFDKVIPGCISTIKGPQQGFLHVNFEKFCKFFTDHRKDKYFCYFQTFIRFYHCPQNIISPITLRQLPLGSPTKANKNPLQSVVLSCFVKQLVQKKLNIPSKMLGVEYRLHKIMGRRVKPL